VNNNPISNCDYLGLNLYGPGLVDVFPCFLTWHHLPVGLILAFVPAAKNCPLKEDQSCCNGANTVFDDSYLAGPGGLPDSTSYGIALALAQVYYQSCMTLGH
jgi:hypothetical protein